MNRYFLCAALTVCGGTAFGLALVNSVNKTLAQLDADTRTQCRERIWPQAQARAHEEFCRVYILGGKPR